MRTKEEILEGFENGLNEMAMDKKASKWIKDVDKAVKMMDQVLSSKEVTKMFQAMDAEMVPMKKFHSDVLRDFIDLMNSIEKLKKQI